MTSVFKATLGIGWGLTNHCIGLFTACRDLGYERNTNVLLSFYPSLDQTPSKIFKLAAIRTTILGNILMHVIRDETCKFHFQAMHIATVAVNGYKANNKNFNFSFLKGLIVGNAVNFLMMNFLKTDPLKGDEPMDVTIYKHIYNVLVDTIVFSTGSAIAYRLAK